MFVQDISVNQAAGGSAGIVNIWLVQKYSLLTDLLQ